MAKPSDPKTRGYMFTDDIKYLQKIVILHPEDQDRFLALQRSADDFSRPDDRDIVGGNLLYGTDADIGLAQEILEEVGLTGDQYSTPQIMHHDGLYVPDKKQYFIGNCWMTQAYIDHIMLSHEHQAYKRVTQIEFGNLCDSDWLKEYVYKVLDRKKRTTS